MPYGLYIKGSAEPLGTITDEQLAALIELLEEESADDHDYYIDADLLAYLEDEGVDPELLALLRPHVRDDEGIEIEWREQAAG